MKTLAVTAALLCATVALALAWQPQPQPQPHPGYLAYGPARIVIGPHGVPLDTAEVAAAKEIHAAAHQRARAQLSGHHYHYYG